MKRAEALGQEVIDELLGPVAGHLEDGDLVFRPALRAAVLPTIAAALGIFVALVLPLALGASAINQPDNDAPGILGVFLALAANAQLLFLFTPAFAPVINVLTTRYVLGAEGIRERKQFLNKEERRVQWEKVTALRHHRSLLDRAVGVERLTVIAYGERGAVLKLIGLSDAAALRDHVSQCMRRSASVDALLRAD